MKFSQLFTLFQPFLLVSARFNDPDNSRIIGGKETTAGRFPFTVSLSDDIGHFCGGSLIAPDVVLTAAHCQGGKYNVIVGRHDLSDDRAGESIPMDYELPHPEYDDMTTNNDFNLVFLSRPVSQKYLKLVTLNSHDDSPAVGDSVVVMGWGDTAKEDDVQTLSDVLMGVEVKMISNEDCDSSKGSIYGYTESYRGQITSNMMCARDDNQDSCQGDSGGPLVVKGKGGSDDVQVGVVSWGIGCASESFPGVYSRISKAYDWIKKEVCAKSNAPPSSFGCGSSSSLAMEYGNQSESEASNFVSGSHQKSGFRQYENWSTLLDEDFKSGYTFFNNGGIGTTLYQTAKTRSGVSRLSNGASISSKKITGASSFDQFQVLVSFQFITMDEGSGICLDFSSDDGASWEEFACHRSSPTFTNDVWYDGISADLKASDHIENLMIRLRSFDNQGDTLIDKVTIQGLAS